MPSLTIRNIPEETIRRMRRAAKQQHRSLNSQALEWLAQSARQSRSATDLRALLDRISSTRQAMQQRYGRGTDSVELIRDLRRRGRR